MAAVANQPPTDFVLRYRMRTLLFGTAIVAVLAAIGGPYFRRQTPQAQIALTVLWGTIVVMTLVSIAMRLRDAWRSSSVFSAKFVVTLRSARHGHWSRTMLMLLWLVTAAIGVAAISVETAKQTQRRGIRSGIWPTAARGWWIGSALAGSCFAFVRRPLLLCDDFIPLGNQKIPWKWIRSVEPLAKRPGAYRFHRLDGDLYVEAAPAERAAVEEFLRSKAPFVDPKPSIDLAPPGGIKANLTQE